MHVCRTDYIAGLIDKILSLFRALSPHDVWADALGGRASPSGSGGGSYPGWLAPGTCVLLSRSHACYSKQPIR